MNINREIRNWLRHMKRKARADGKALRYAYTVERDGDGDYNLIFLRIAEDECKGERHESVSTGIQADEFLSWPVYADQFRVRQVQGDAGALELCRAQEPRPQSSKSNDRTPQEPLQSS